MAVVRNSLTSTFLESSCNRSTSVPVSDDPVMEERGYMTTVTKFTVEESQAIVDKRVFWRLLFLPAMFAGFSALFFGWPSDHPAVVGTLWVITAYMMFCGTSCLHEAVHQTLWPNKQASIVMGRFIGTFVLVPYTVYRETHIYHHAYLNRPEDWELWPYSDPNCSLGFRRLFVWFDLLMGWLATPLIFSRIYFSKRSPLRKPSIRRVIRNEYLLIVLYWTLLIGIVVALGYGRQFAWAVLPPWILAGVFQSVRKMTEHLGMSSYHPLLGTRTVIPNSWLLRLSSYLNFDIFVHGLHHRHPKMAHDQMRQKFIEYQQDNPHADYPAYHSYWRASLAMLPYLFRNPGSGVNAGGAPPGRSLDDRDLNFYSDVVEEVLAKETCDSAPSG